MAAVSSSSQLLLLLPAVLILLLLLSSLHPSAGDGADQITMRMTLINQCNYAVWPGILANKGLDQFRGGGCKLERGDIFSFVGLSAGWSGRVWVRTHCSSENATFTCATGDCGPNVECAGRSGALPFTVGQLAVDATGQTMTYDVNIVEGFNVPMAVTAVSTANGTSCPVAGCQMDLLGIGTCPSEQMFFSPAVVGGRSVVGCRSICPSGKLGPCEMSETVKRQCPNLITFKDDKAAETMMCKSVREVQVVFCPARMAAVTLLKQAVFF